MLLSRHQLHPDILHWNDVGSGIPGHQQQRNSKGGSNFKEDQSLCGGKGGGGGEVREESSCTRMKICNHDSCVS